MRFLSRFVALVLALAPVAALSQSAPNLVTGQVPTAAQWNSYFAAKQDYNPNLGCAFSPCYPAIQVFPNSVLQTNASGVPSFSDILPSGTQLLNPQFSGTTAGGILSGNYSLSTSGQAQITNTTPSTNSTTGAVTIAGGLGVGGNLNVGGTISSSAIPSGGNTASPLSSILGRIVTPIDFGAKGDGVTNDTTAVQNAINYLENSGTGGTLYLGQYQYCINQININGTVPIRIVGTGNYGQQTPTTGFRACSANLNPMINIGNVNPNTGWGVTLDNFGINMQTPSGTFSNTGVAIQVNGYRDRIDNVSITDPCIGILEAGNNDVYTNNVIAGFFNNLNLANCGGIRFGTSTQVSVDALVLHNAIVLPSGNSNGSNAYGWGMFFANAGGTYIIDNDILYSQNGTYIGPVSGQAVQWLQMDNTVLGDSTYGNGLTIQPGSGGLVTGIFCEACWAGNIGNWQGKGTWTSATGLWLHNDNGGTVTGIKIIGLKQMGSYGPGIAIGTNVNDTQVIGAQFCGDGHQGANTSDAVLVYGSNVVLSGNYIASNCFGTVSTTLANGIHIVSGGTDLIQGNWIGADDNGTKNVTTGITIASGTGTICEGNNFVNAITNTSFYTGFTSYCY